MNIRYLTSAAITFVIAGAVVAVLLVSGGSAKAPPARPSAPSPTILATRHTSLGTVLVDGHGRTLYLFEADGAGVSHLSSAGLAVWPRFTASGAVRAGRGVQAAKLGMVTSPKGARELTYAGHPLYYYVGDPAPGSVRGQGLKEFGALWYVLGPGGSAVTSSPTASPTAAPTPATGAGY